ncbi:MAG: Fic family protein [Candidatus Omnitrophica bacterium]|nr:Fic family protein [Candidatus Omnitrophota bacterium]
MSIFIKKIDTFKSGVFVLGNKYDLNKISNLLSHVKALYASFDQIPILPRFAGRLEEELIKRSIFGTAALEGNPLTEDEVGKIVSKEYGNKETQLKNPEIEIKNLKSAYQVIKNFPVSIDRCIDIDEEAIKNIHKIITLDIVDEDNLPGTYRNHKVFVGDKAHGGVYIPPKILDDVKNIMEQFVLWVNSDAIKQEDPLIRAILVHYYLALIHPFGNGNGRTARIAEAIMLKSSGIRYFASVMLSNYYYSNIDNYFSSFSLSERNDNADITPFVEFCLQGMIVSCKELQERVYSGIRALALRDYYRLLKSDRKILQRQCELLLLLLQTGEQFTLSDLMKGDLFLAIYKDKGERTVRRDIESLTVKNLIKQNKEGKYTLNIHVLDFSSSN